MSTLCQKWLKKNGFFSKSSRFRVVWTIQFCLNFTSMWPKYLSNNVWRDIRLPMSAIETVAGKSLTLNLLQKLIFRSGILYMYYHCWCWHWSLKSLHTLFKKKWLTIFDKVLTIADADIEVWSLSIHYLKRKWLTIFDKVLTPFWKTFLWLKQ